MLVQMMVALPVLGTPFTVCLISKPINPSIPRVDERHRYCCNGSDHRDKEMDRRPQPTALDHVVHHPLACL
jgi:hypothetical protein